jgi:hypothetical protein
MVEITRDRDPAYVECEQVARVNLRTCVVAALRLATAAERQDALRLCKGKFREEIIDCEVLEQ